MKWRAVYVGALVALALFREEADALVARAWAGLQANPLFTHDSFEPVLSTACLHIWVALFYAIDHWVPWTRRSKEENRTWKAGGRLWGWRPTVFYLAPLLLMDALYPRRKLEMGAPTAWQVLSEVVLMLVVYDAVFFAAHWTLHRVPLLMRRVHTEHHRHTPVRASETMRMTAAELAVDVGISIFAVNVTRSHPLSRALYDVVITYLLCELHCSRDMAWMLHNVVPFGVVGGPMVHARHHASGRFHFGKFFTWTDKLARTVPSAKQAAVLDAQVTAPPGPVAPKQL